MSRCWDSDVKQGPGHSTRQSRAVKGPNIWAGQWPWCPLLLCAEIVDKLYCQSGEALSRAHRYLLCIEYVCDAYGSLYFVCDKGTLFKEKKISSFREGSLKSAN